MGCKEMFRAYRWAYAGLNATGRRYASTLIRLAAAVEAIPRQEGSDCADAIWRSIRLRDEGHGVNCPRLWGERLFRKYYLPEPSIQFGGYSASYSEACHADPRPGNYYVSATDGEHYRLVAGPWPTHAEAIQAVATVRRMAEQVDPRACWYAWGTARTDEGHVERVVWSVTEVETAAADMAALKSSSKRRKARE